MSLITDVQNRADGGYYATVDGAQCEFVGDGDDGEGNCDNCGRWRADILCDYQRRLDLCRECLEKGFTR